MRPLDELIVAEEPGLDLLRDWTSRDGANQVVVLPPNLASRGAALQRFQVTTRSLLGAVVYETGGLLVAGGRLRVFGSGQVRSILRIAEAVGTFDKSPGVLLIADDTAGGLYALNGGRFGQDGLGSVFYLSADQTAWTTLDIGYADFIAWCATGNLSFVFEDVDRHAFPAGKTVIEIDKVRSFHPFLWTTEGADGNADVRLIDADESLRLRIELLGFDVDR